MRAASCQRIEVSPWVVRGGPRGRWGCYMWNSERIPATLADGLVHRQDILRWHSRLDVMRRVKNVSAGSPENLQPRANFLPNLLGCAEGKRALRINAATPEGYAVAKLFLQFFGGHARSRTLNGVDDVETRLDKVRQERPHRAAGMNEAFPLRIFMDPVVDFLVEWFEKVAVRFDGNEGAVLLAKVCS